MSFAPARAELAGLPLAALPAVALDSETTGLSVADDRIIELGALRLRAGAIDAGDQFHALVDPGMPIPPASTAIHTITDDDVAGAATFPAAMARLAAWVGDDVVIGYSIGFDLAILQAEHERHGLAWRAPRSLDVRHLAQVVAPTLPSPALEALAAWLGIAVDGRHRALADARLAGEIFLALLPLLREVGVVTLAQAEQASLGLVSRLRDEAQAGWHAPASAEPGYARIDSFPYRHRVADLMRAPALTVAPTARLRQALADMMRHRVSSVFVQPTGAGDAHGIVTERDVLRAIDADGTAALDAAVEGYASRPLVSVDADEFIYRALVGMADRGFRHLGVRDAAGRLVGALSARDLLRQRADDVIRLGDSIERAENTAELAQIWAALTTVARGLVAEQVDARDIAAIVSRELRALTARAAVLAERDMGPPPVPYALLVLGSGGRGESLLAMDQDNAIVFAEGAPGGTADRWFAKLGQRIADTLDGVGVAYCKGGIMASNAAWRMDRDGWRRAVAGWVVKARARDILNCDIFFDAASVHGEAAMADALLAEARQRAAQARVFLQAMAVNAANVDVPLGWFSRFRLQDGRVDLKKGGIMPIFGAARVLALRCASDARTTPDRLRAARRAGLVDDAALDGLVEAHRILLDAILRQQLADLEAGIALSNRVATAGLSAYRRQELRWALQRVAIVPDLLGVAAGVAR